MTLNDPEWSLNDPEWTLRAAVPTPGSSANAGNWPAGLKCGPWDTELQSHGHHTGIPRATYGMPMELMGRIVHAVSFKFTVTTGRAAWHW